MPETNALTELLKTMPKDEEQNYSAEEAIHPGLRRMKEKDARRQIKLEQLRQDIAVAVESEERGEVASLAIEAIIAEGKRH